MDKQTLGTHRGTYDAVFQHPISRNLQWRDVRSMLESVADRTEEGEETVKFTRSGQTLTLHPPKRKDFSDIQALMQIRHFLEKAEAPAPDAMAEGIHLLVVLDHREARVFRAELHGSVPQRITPFDPHGNHRHLHHVENDTSGQRKPEPKAYYEAIAQTLAGAKSILLMGSSTGSSSAMDHLLADLKQHHPEVAKHVAGTIVVNEQHMSEDQFLAEARSFYAKRDA